MSPSQYFTYRNLFDENGAFVGGKTLTLNWKLPTAPKTSLSGVSFFVLYPEAGVDRTSARLVDPRNTANGAWKGSGQLLIFPGQDKR
ncbi:hypothetical protein [Piscinibacter sp.]|uniref:hypothetical protein n=1 Tax=Piscinibacter sp. TaxID=1903157 RepID=UPI002D13D785|nr:hypothetical protein [Albitalea sp.]HUG24769.1 hypothetical protein [Albitalea sp.]